MRTTISSPRPSLEFLIELRALSLPTDPYPGFFPYMNEFSGFGIEFIILADLRNLLLRHEFGVVRFCTGSVWNIFSVAEFLPMRKIQYFLDAIEIAKIS